MQNKLVLSATDLANHLACPHVTTLNMAVARGEVEEPTWEDPHLAVLRQRGLEHEKAYLETLRSRGLAVVDLSEQSGNASTLAAMRDGIPVIYQGSLRSGNWNGRTDVLLRVERPSALGRWSYEAVDCKLASQTKAETVLQLCLYCELLGELQGCQPEWFHVIRPEVGFQPESYRTASFAAYYRAVKRSLEAAVRDENAKTYPEPVSHCEMCRWWKRCDQQLRRDDHLSFVAGATKLHRKELAVHQVTSLEALAKVPLPIPFRPARGAQTSYVRIREQARIQHEARTKAEYLYELLDFEPGKGLFRLPEPTAGDIFLDFEGDPFVAGGGREYLFGVLIQGGAGQLRYEGRWALDRKSERMAFEWLIDFTHARLEQHPGLHIYHFGGYEPGAIKRLMLRYSTREDEVDRLLRGEVFVDLYSITKQSIRASVEQYSLKDLERLFGFKRRISLADASQARHVLEHQLELSSTPVIDPATSQLVEQYNVEDCGATERLRAWLEEIRMKCVSEGANLSRPEVKDATASEAVSERQKRVQVLFSALTHDLPEEPEARTPEQAARWLLAHALNWHRREEKVKWWEFFRLRDLPEEELYDAKAALAGLSYRQRMPKRTPRERSPIDQYEYPPQECSINVGDKLHVASEERFGEVVAIDRVRRTIDVKKPATFDTVHPTSVFAHNIFGCEEQSEAILRLADWIVRYGLDSDGDYRAARDLLLRLPPRLGSGELFSAHPDEQMTSRACRIGRSLNSSTLAIQGPPGAGKTYTGARMICDLVRHGKRVGITAVSHKVIRNLLEEVLVASTEGVGANIQCGHKNEGDEMEEDLIRQLETNEATRCALAAGEVNVLGGTSWLWAREDMFEAVDVLVVDEAGQMSLANVLACAQAGKSLVLLGDPQQLEQPQKGSHPEGSDVSALAHLLGETKTIPEDRGLFLGETWRLHPSICEFTSEMFYEERLHSRERLRNQVVEGPIPFAGAGLWFVPVHHEGNQSHSTEEIDRIAGIVEGLTAGGVTWVTSEGIRLPLTLDEILIVAPYNDQVNRFQERLPDARVGTVDKFQGQEAAVVIYSLTTSSQEDAPRGMEFLYNLNRFNVASSRARCTCIVVGSPRLLAPNCRTPRQMELANALCRYSELATLVPADTRTAVAGRQLSPSE